MIDVLDENFKKLDMVRKYTFYQYSDKCRDIGTFELRVPVVKETKWIVDRQKTRYVLFDNHVLGKIQKITYSSDSENEREIILSGNLALYILKKRVIRGTVTFKGQSYKYIETLITSFVGNPDYPGMINVSVQFDDEERLKKVCSVVDRQATGGYVWDEISEVCEIDKLSVELIPTVVPEQSIDGVRTNISGWTFVISAGVERTRKNKDGNVPVVFSQKMSNISGADYNRDSRDFAGLAILAGEGEEEQRKWFSVSREGLENKTGWDVEELWIDARDLQSEVDGEDALTEEEYEELIKARAKEKLAENDVKESYASTLVTALNKQYTFGKDYRKADFVTVDDEELGLSVDAQITTVTVSEQNGRKIIDPEFTYGNIVRDPMEGLKENVILSKQNMANIRYIDNMISRLLTCDRVIEEGSDGRWSYRKWENGTLEAWIEEAIEHDFEFNLAFGNIFYRDYFTLTTSGKANQFVSVGTAFVNSWGGGIVWVSQIGFSRNSDSSVSVNFFTASATKASYKVRLTAYVIGRWK